MEVLRKNWWSKKISPGLSHADFELTFQLVNAPLHGELMMSGRPMKDGYDFTQEDLNKIYS